MFDYDDSINLSFDAKIAGKSLVAAKHEVLTKTGDFLFLAHSERELAQRMQMVEEDIEKTAYRKLANLSDSKAKLVRVLHEEWQLRHANCEMCKVALQMPASGGAAPAMQSMMTAVPGAKDPGIVKDVTDTAKGVANAVGTGVGAYGKTVENNVKSVGSEITKLPGQVGDAAKSVGTGIADAAKGTISGVGSLISQFTQGVKGDSAPAVKVKPNSGNMMGNSMLSPATTSSKNKVALQMPASGGAAPAPTGPGADIGKAIGDVSKGVAKGYGAAAVAPLHGMGDATKAVGNAVGDVMPIGGGVVKNISNVMGDRQNNIADTIDKGVKSVGSFADSAAKGIGNAEDTGAKAVGSEITKIPGQVGDAAKSVVKSICNFFSSKNFDDRYENEKLRLAASKQASKGDQKNCAECGKPATKKDVHGYLELCDNCAK